MKDDDTYTEDGRYILPPGAAAVILYEDGSSAALTPRGESDEQVPQHALLAIMLYTYLHEGEEGVAQLREHFERGKAAAN